MFAPCSIRHECGPYPLLTAAHNEVGFYVVLLQVGVPFSPCSRLDIVVPIQVIQSGLSDVDTPEMGTTHRSPT